MIAEAEELEYDLDAVDLEEDEEVLLGGNVLPPLEEDDVRFLPQVYRTDRELAIIAPTHIMSPKVSFAMVQEHYKQNPRKALRDYLCVASTSTEPFFRDPDILDIRVNEGRQHPFTSVEIISARGKDDFLTKHLRSDFRPVPGKTYTAHVDTSKNRDATGVAIAHWDKAAVREVEGVGTVTGQIVVDLMVRIWAPPHEDIHYAGIRELFMLLKLRGFPFHVISFDQFNSLDMMQILQKKGFPTEALSVDRKTDAYDTLQEMLLLGKVDYYPYTPLREEARVLILKPNGKVDHPERMPDGSRGKKDVADATAGAVYLSRLFAGNEVYATSETMTMKQAVQSVTLEDVREREEILGFREVRTIW